MTDSSVKRKVVAGEKLRDADKVSRIPIKVVPAAAPLPKPEWRRIKLPDPAQRRRVEALVAETGLHTVCQEAACPNLAECFHHGTATFMIMGDICTRRCPFCDVAHGRPLALDQDEPARLAGAVRKMRLRYVVITSVDRDDLMDGGAGHYAACIQAVRAANPGIKVEILVPDFRGRMEQALEMLGATPPDVLNHNLETVPRLYKSVRPGADYQWSLDLLQRFKQDNPGIPTKSGLMLGLGETLEEIRQVMQDLRLHGCELLTLGQYLQPSPHHLPVSRYVTPAEFEQLKTFGESLGFSHVASGPFVRSSYHADIQAAGLVE
ncbi:lipoyl synthase [Sedimenticola selenatireducens]|uniref:Lipoyl synthase n=1 Tax=Sedimenticola selenatireducens TaxID=191960 RepID=A0A2N6D130_9GAMM|nr:lipoyl synthase [Sedimenticola selenatireducens]PLX63399.1 MAG: lipoyl synthase [Sedimenticola selenatireducens]